MLGLFGFSIAALVFALYGATVLGYQNKKTKSSFNLNTYSNSFFLAVLACLSWAYATQQIASLVKPAVLIGDIFLLLATTLLLRTILVKNKNQYTFAAIALGAVAV